MIITNFAENSEKKMNENILKLKPEIFWKNFREITLIPRPSKHEEKVTDFLLNFGKKFADKSYKDSAGNVIWSKKATIGMENRQPIVLQAHCDMVPQKNEDKKHDFLTDPISTVIDGDFVKADGTTLGADDGAGVAVIMSVFEDKNIQHPNIEALITVDEETGLTGANGLKPNTLSGKMLLNLDSEEDNIFYIGCAGGVNVHIAKKLEYETVSKDYKCFSVKVADFMGGHSGSDIHKNRPNAVKLLFRFFDTVNYVKVSSFEGGNMHNAIPREAVATVFVPKTEEENFKNAAKNFQKILSSEYHKSDPDGKIFIQEIADCKENTSLTDECFKTVKMLISTIISGVYAMSADMPGLVETSNNLSVAKTENGELKILCLMRSSSQTQCDYLKGVMKFQSEFLGAEIKFTDEYPGWQPDTDSVLLKEATMVYEKLFGEKPLVTAIHAGLECGIITAKHAGMEALSLGPTMYGVHTPNEKLEIKSVAKFYTLISEILKNSPEKK